MRQGCVLPAEGAQRAASNSTASSAGEIDSPDIARGDHRTTKRPSTGRSAFRWSRPRTGTRLVSHPKNAGRRPVHGALLEPLERGTEERRMVLLPHRVVRGAPEIDHHLLRRAEICLLYTSDAAD